MPAQRNSNFAATCNLLSQYLKEKKGELGDLMAITKGRSETPRTMSLLPGVGKSAADQQKPQLEEIKPAHPNPGHGGASMSQMTIFYAGRVIVIDHFPEEKAVDLVEMAGKATPTADNQPKKPPPDHHLAASSDLPMARRASHGRMLERRKYRVISSAPYQVTSGSSSAPMARSNLAKPDLWFGLAPSFNPSVQ